MHFDCRARAPPVPHSRIKVCCGCLGDAWGGLSRARALAVRPSGPFRLPARALVRFGGGSLGTGYGCALRWPASAGRPRARDFLRLAPPWAGLAPLASPISPGFAARPARTAGKPAFPAGAPLATVSSYFMVILWPLNAALGEGPSVGVNPPFGLHRFANCRHFFGGLAKQVQAYVGEMVGGGGGYYLVVLWKEAAWRPRANFGARAGHGLGSRSATRSAARS